MVKYISTIVVKQGYSSSTINVLYANPLRILDEEYIKQAFYPPSGSKPSSQIGGSLLNPNTNPNNAWISSQGYLDFVRKYNKEAFAYENLFPIYEFSDSDSFHIWFANLFNIYANNNNHFPIFNDPSELLLLK